MYSYSEEERIIKKAIRDLFPIISFKNKLIDNVDEFIKNGVKILQDNGYYTINIEEQYGGLELDFKTSAIILAEIAKGNATLAHLVSTNCFGFCNLVQEFGSDTQRQKYLTSIVSEKKTGTFIYNEPDASNWDNISTVARKSGDKFILRGQKTMITNSKNADYGLVFAKVIDDNEEVYFSFFIIELKKSDSITIGETEKTMGMEGIGIATIHIDDYIIDKNDMLGSKDNALKILIKMLGKSRLCNAAFSYGIASTAYNEAIEYSKTHIVDGKPLINNTYINAKIADMYCKLDIMETSLFYCAELVDKGIGTVANSSASTKYYVTEAAKEICDLALQFHGGYGYIKDYFIERLYRDVRINTIIGGSSESILTRMGQMIATNQLIHE